MKPKYSEAFIEQAVVKLLSRGARTVREVALDLNVNYYTAKNWIKRGSVDPACRRRLNIDHLCRFKIDQGLKLPF